MGKWILNMRIGVGGIIFRLVLGGDGVGGLGGDVGCLKVVIRWCMRCYMYGRISDILWCYCGAWTGCQIYSGLDMLEISTRIKSRSIKDLNESNWAASCTIFLD